LDPVALLFVAPAVAAVVSLLLQWEEEVEVEVEEVEVEVVVVEVVEEVEDQSQTVERTHQIQIASKIFYGI